MGTKKMGKKTMRRMLLVTLPIFILTLYFISEIITYSFRIINLNQEQKVLASELSNLKSKEQDLKIEIQKLQDPEYIARYARENYLYSKDGEYIIKIDTKDNNVDSKETSTKTKWYTYVLPITIGLSILFILFRNNNIKNAKKKVLR